MGSLASGCAPPAPAERPAGRAFGPPASELRYVVLEGGRRTGSASQRREADGVLSQKYDGGENSKLEVTLALDARGVFRRYAAKGKQWSSTIDESFQAEGASASWHDRTGTASAPTNGAFYWPPQWNEMTLGLLARALLAAPQRQLALLPSGSASIERLGSLPITIGEGRREVTQYLIAGFDRSPWPIWLDENGDVIAVSDGWTALVREGFEGGLPEIERAQEHAAAERRARLGALGRRPKALLIRNARLFDPLTLRVTAGTSVASSGSRIVAVGPDGRVDAPAGAEIIDAGGRFLMPGLWDNHAHLWRDWNPLMYVAAGVTTVREMGNLPTLPAWVKRLDAGVEVGPRVLMVQNVSGAGDEPFRANQTFVADERELEAVVSRAAEAGYVQMKARDIKPTLVPALVRSAHARRMRVSGHVPDGMSARQFVEAGAEEIQHLGFVTANFFFGQPPQPGRSSALRFAEELTTDAPVVRDFLGLLAARQVAIDVTTLGPSQPGPGEKGEGPLAPPAEYQYLSGRVPLEMQRALTDRVNASPNARKAFESNMRLFKAMHQANVTLVPGTEGVDLAGIGLLGELEVWALAGVAPAEVLRMATYDSARNMHVESDLGTLAPGKYADMLLVDGDPTVKLSDLRRGYRVIKDGWVYEPLGLFRALGITPAP